MKKILIIIFCILSYNCFAQENVRLSNVFFLSVSSNKSRDFIAKDTIIIVPNGKAWQITNAKVFMTYDNRVSGENTYLYINDQIITYSNTQFAQNTDPIWLPTGKYRITIRTEEKSQREGRFYFNGFISGIEHNISK